MAKRQRPEEMTKELQQKQKKGVSKQVKKSEKNSNSWKGILAPKLTSFKACDFSKEVHLPREFFRQEVVELAKALLGKVFVRKTEKGDIRAVIVETEAYKAPLDKACHAYNSSEFVIQIKKQREPNTFGWMEAISIFTQFICLQTFVSMWLQDWKGSLKQC